MPCPVNATGLRLHLLKYKVSRKDLLSAYLNNRVYISHLLSRAVLCLSLSPPCGMIWVKKGGVFLKLDSNCVRDVLLYLESEPYVRTNENGRVEFVGVWLPSICKQLSAYPQEVIFYTLSKLEEGEYIDMSVQWASGGVNVCRVNYITYNGHEFLEKIRPDTVWEKTIGIAGKVGNFSLQMLAKISEGVATTLIKELITGG